MKKPYGLWKRDKIYYYRLTGGTWRSTGCRQQAIAIGYALRCLEEARAAAAQQARFARTVALRDYLEPFYRWDSCPHIARLRAEKKHISKQHAAHQRVLIDKYILKDPLADFKVQELRRGDIIDFRQRMIACWSDRQVNRIIGVLKTCIKEGVYREELEKDPTIGVGNIHEEKKERGIFMQNELAQLFPKDGSGPWENPQSYTCFLTAATTGLRRGEVLALRWKDIEFDNKVVHVRQAWKDDTTLGPPKWGKKREGIPLPSVTIEKLLELREYSLHILPDSLVFHNPDGSRLTFHWWQKQFLLAMTNADIDVSSRKLTAHSFRHSLNTLLRDRGVPDEKIRAAMGWSNPKTQAGYTHWRSEHLRGQADIIDSIF